MLKEPLHKYKQIKEILLSQIKDSKLKSGAKVPSENELVRIYNVSRNTVMHALNDLVNEGLLYRVQGKGTFLAEPNASQPKLLATADLWGVLIPDVVYFFSEIVRGIEDAANERNYGIILCNTDNDAEKRNWYLDKVQNKDKVKGIILNLHNESRFPEVKNIINVPFVVIDYCPRDAEVPYVIFDNIMGVYRAIVHLIRLGHRRIAYIGTKHPNYNTDDERLQGYKKALNEHGISFDESLIKRMDNAFSGNEEAQMKIFFEQKDRPTAIFTFNDARARTIFNFIKRLGLKVPDDIALIGYDDTDIAKTLEVPLTSVAPPRYELGCKAAGILFQSLEEGKKGYEHIVLQPELIIRDSCGASQNRKKI